MQIIYIKSGSKSKISIMLSFLSSGTFHLTDAETVQHHLFQPHSRFSLYPLLLLLLFFFLLTKTSLIRMDHITSHLGEMKQEEVSATLLLLLLLSCEVNCPDAEIFTSWVCLVHVYLNKLSAINPALWLHPQAGLHTGIPLHSRQRVQPRLLSRQFSNGNDWCFFVFFCPISPKSIG